MTNNDRTSSTNGTTSSATGSPADAKDGTPPRLPHEHDESSDSASKVPDPKMEQAAKDVASGKQATDRGETTDPVYRHNLAGDRG